MNKIKRLLISMLTLLCCCTGVWAEGELNGLFTINPSGDKVQFSQGNLRYQASTGTWRFAENQYDYIGNAAGNTSPSSSQTAWIDFFNWGTSGYNHGANCYQPWSTSKTQSDYYAYGSSSKNLYDAKNDESMRGQADWGYNAISNGGNTENSGWRTLTKDEWAYLINSRSDAYRYAKGTIHSKNGLMLFPDGFILPTGVSISNANTASASYTSYSDDIWTALEAAGVVFLPATGLRNGTSVQETGSVGNYWSSTYMNADRVYNIRFDGSSLKLENDGDRQNGFPVRLAKDYQLPQDAEGNYLIGSAYDWDLFATLVQTTPTANAKMTADIDLGTQITMIASDFDHPYQGTFDGQGHTLTVNWTTNGEDRIAPFRYAEGATIKKLHVDGSISKTDAQGRCPAGILACSIGSATTTITECWSSVSLYAFDTIGGLFCVACGNSTTNIIDCVFSGTISASHSWGYSGGFASHADKTYLYNTEGAPTVNITRGLNLGTFSGGTTETYTFIRADANAVYGTHTVNSCYYKNVYGHAQGTQATTAELVNGTTATALQSSRAEAVWVQDPVTNQPMLAIFANGVTLTDGDNLSALETFASKTCRVAYSRSFTEAKSSTVCLPFAFAKGSVGTFYTFTGISKSGNDYIADMTEYTGANLVANTPYLFTPSATGNVDFSGMYEIPASITAGSTVSGDWTYLGTYETIEWTEAPTGIYGFSAQAVADQGISQGEFVKVGEYVRIKPMRCYLKYKNGSADYAGSRGLTRAATAGEQLPDVIKVRLISANGEVTAIGTLQTKTGEVTIDSEAWYSIDGRRIVGKPSAKGIYVRSTSGRFQGKNNGKKVVIK